MIVMLESVRVARNHRFSGKQVGQAFTLPIRAKLGRPSLLQRAHESDDVRRLFLRDGHRLHFPLPLEDDRL